MSGDFEAIVVGGGAAGLSAALVLGRARRRTLLIDAGGQSNLSAEHVGGLLGHIEVSPAELYERGRRQLSELDSVELLERRVESAEADAEGATVTTADGDEFRARRLILATGQSYELPDIPGVADHWGRTVFHCPFCHGWEMRDRRVAVLAPDPDDHRITLIRGWTDDVVVVDPADVARVRSNEEGVEALELEGGSEVACDGVLVPTELKDRDELADGLGLERTDAGFVEVDGQMRTSVESVYAVGDVAVAPQQVSIAIGSGHLAAAMVVRDLLMA